MRVQRAEPRPPVCVSKAARGDGCERFVNSAGRSAALMFTRVTRAAAGRARTCTHTHTHLYSTYRSRVFTFRQIQTRTQVEAQIYTEELNTQFPHVHLHRDDVPTHTLNKHVCFLRQKSSFRMIYTSRRQINLPEGLSGADDQHFINDQDL